MMDTAATPKNMTKTAMILLNAVCGNDVAVPDRGHGLRRPPDRLAEGVELARGEEPDDGGREQRDQQGHAREVGEDATGDDGAVDPGQPAFREQLHSRLVLAPSAVFLPTHDLLR